MSSMTRKFASLSLLALVATSAPAQCQGVVQDGGEWDRARAELIASQPTGMAQAISRWQSLTQGGGVSFNDYAGFLLAYPGFPDEGKLRVAAEAALATSPVEPSRLVAFFDRFPPVTNPARAQYALALAALGRSDAAQVGRTAWRGGPMSDSAEAAIQSQFGGTFIVDDQDARADALLWAGAADQAARAMANVSAAARPTLMARLALVQGSEPASQGLAVGADALRDTGYVYNRIRQLRRGGRLYEVVNLLATRPQASRPVLDQRKWVGELLNAAKGVDAGSAVRIAASVDDAFPAGQDVSRLSFQIRDDYTSLMWLGATKALKSLGDGARAAPLFYRYGSAARTPQTRSKGFYWAGRSLARAGDAANAARYYDMAAQYPDQFYGMLANEQLGRPLPAFVDRPTAVPTAADRAAFAARPITQAVREVARSSDWQTGVRFFREICDSAQSEVDHVMVAELAQQLGRRDLGVILGQAAHSDGYGNFHHVSFPLIPVPQGSSWTMVHAISRQESQFAQNAISHAGARGLMQLMPGTAREQALMLGYAYDFNRLTADPGYNTMLGDFYFGRLMDTYRGSYPLAVAAYNAGPGNVNRWLRDNGDPRNGSIDWVDWIEKIPLSETRGYVQHVLENAVVYDTMNPRRALYTGPNMLSHFLGKQTPG
jgi:soluble lytic murein transglycosylase